MIWPHLALECQRVDCEAAVAVDLDAHDRTRTLAELLPEGWGWDRHDGINAALHCPAHREAPTPEEVEEAHRRAADREQER